VIPTRRPQSKISESSATQVLLISLAAVLVALIYSEGIRLGMRTTIHARHGFYSIPAALSRLYFGGGGYTSFEQIADAMAQGFPDFSNAQINAILATPHVDTTKLFFFPGDDKGTLDFVIFSFRLFGPRIESLYYGFFVLLSVSLIVYVIQFRQQLNRLVFLNLLLLSLYASLFVYPLTRELYSLHNPRVFGVIALVPLFHLCFLAWDAERMSPRSVFLAVPQVVLLVEAYHVRSTELWEIIVAAAFIGGVATHRLVSQRARRCAGDQAPVLSTVWPLFLLMIGVVGLWTYQRAVYNPAYFRTQLQQRVFWHNVGIGFALHPTLAARYRLAIDDQPMIDLVRARATRSGNDTLRLQIFGAPGEVHHGIAKDFVAYERVAREVVWDIVRNNPGATTSLFLYYKPRALLDQGLWAVGLIPDDFVRLHIDGQIGSLETPSGRVRKDLYLTWRRLPIILVLTGLGLLCWLLDIRLGFEFLLTGAAFIGSLLPGFLTYPLIHTLGVAVVPAFLLFCISVEIAGSRLGMFLRPVSPPAA
jgi:hypothetical protein